jgi:20S proteasome alpha/beta subunit
LFATDFVHLRPARIVYFTKIADMLKLSSREVKAMTIGIGLTTPEGVVLASDTQVTVEGFFKDDDCKLREISFADEGAVVASFAGYPSLMNIAYKGLVEALSAVPRPEWKDIDKRIGASLSELRTKHPEEMACQQFLFAVSSPLQYPTLYRADGDVLSVEPWTCIGVGDSSLVRFLIGRFWRSDLSVECAILLAAYIVHYAKKYIDKVGGDTQIFVVRGRGDVQVFSGQAASAIDQLLGEFEDVAGRLLGAWADKANSDSGVNFVAPIFCRKLLELRRKVYPEAATG